MTPRSRNTITALLAVLAAACTELPTTPSADASGDALTGPETNAARLMVTGPFDIHVPGTFDFRDGTTQGWTLLQLYRTTGGPVPSNRIATFQGGRTSYTPFTLSNPQGLSLMAYAPDVSVIGSPIPRVDIYFQSPDLSGNRAWQGAQGYELDVMRSYESLCGDPVGYRAQLQVVVRETRTGAQRVFADWTFPRIDYYRNHRLAFRTPVMSDSRFTVQYLRIRMMMMPNYLENCLANGSWFIGNVKPIP